jgi:DNA-binding NarL/FixJ family response regulator
MNSHPVLILVVMEPSSPRTDVNAVVAQIKARWPQTRLVVLVDTEQQRQAVTLAGADRVWFKGALAAQMLVEIEALLNGKD